jgi:hypothetical protein
MSTTEYTRVVVTNAHASIAVPDGSSREHNGQIVCFAIGSQTIRLFIFSPFPTIKTGDEIAIGLESGPLAGKSLAEAIVIVKFGDKIAPFLTEFRPRN